MLQAMRVMGLDFLINALCGNAPVQDEEAWYKLLRWEHPEKVFPYLVESSEKIDRVYIIEKIPDEECCRLLVEDLRADTAQLIPFFKPVGARSPQVGSVFKRTYSKTKVTPVRTTINSTMQLFQELSYSDQCWSEYFTSILRVLSVPRLSVDGHSIAWLETGRYESMIECAVDNIKETDTVFLTVRNGDNRLPGECREYLNYLQVEHLSGNRYATRDAQAQANATCPLCFETGVTIYPNALRGSGINFMNMDRLGAFPRLDNLAAWKRFGLCTNCADLLYIFKNHVLAPRGRDVKIRPFITRIAGDLALVLPESNANCDDRRAILRAVLKILDTSDSDMEIAEDDLLQELKEMRAIMNITFLWAKIGQEITEITGIITDIPPSRLSELSRFNTGAEGWSHILFSKPQVQKDQFYFKPDLAFFAFRDLFQRPGGSKARTVNESKQLSQLKRSLVAHMYHKTCINETRLWAEWLDTARWYLKEAIRENVTYGLRVEGVNKKTSEPFLTCARWIRHVAFWLYYFKKWGIMRMENSFYKPKMEELLPFFGEESGIDNREKAFAFLIGILFGRLLTVQGVREVRTTANALTWLRRLTLEGKDLPRLYVRIREKMFSYEMEKSLKIRSLLNEIAELGIQLGDAIELDEVKTNYYLLLGQSMSGVLFKKEQTAISDEKGV